MYYEITLENIRGHTFWPHALGHDSVVVDLGAHSGNFSREVQARYGCRCFLAEPLPSLFEAIPQIPGAAKTCTAIAMQSGQAIFHLSHNPEAGSLRALSVEHDAGSLQVPTCTFSEFLHEHGLSRIDLLKIDIEGTEIDLLLNLECSILDKIDQITVEFHAHTPELQRERVVEIHRIREVIVRLRRHGFVCLNPSRPFYIDVLFLQPERLKLPKGAFSALRFRYEFFPRLKGILQRRLLRR